MLSLGLLARQFRQHPLGFMQTYAMNLAGVGWFGGSIEQLAFSGIDLSPRLFAAAAINIISACSNMIFGHNDWGVRGGCILGQIGGIVTLWPDLAAGDSATWLGFGIFSLAQACGTFSPELTRAFEQSGSRLLRHTLGSPRRIMGLTNALSRLPILLHGLTAHRPEMVVPYATWFVADIAATLSKAEVSHTRQNPPIPPLFAVAVI